MNLENDLKRALRRTEPDPGFAERVLSRIERSGGLPDRLDARPAKSRPLHWWRAAAASVTLATLLGGYTTYRVVEYKRGERAKEQLLTAMHIASEKVNYAQSEVRGIGSHE